MKLKLIALIGALIVPAALAGCVDGKAKPTSAAKASSNDHHGPLGGKGLTPAQRKWLEGTHARPAGR